MRMKSNSKNILCVLLCIFVLTILSCKNNKSIKQNLDQTLNVNGNGYKLTKLTYSNLDIKATVHIDVYWGIENDTLFIINPLYNYEDCIVKFMVFDFNSNQKLQLGTEKSNCDDIPMFVDGYKIELITKESDNYKIKNSTINHLSNGVMDYCTFDFSFKNGIRNFNYYHFNNNPRIPWAIGKMGNVPAERGQK